MKTCNHILRMEKIDMKKYVDLAIASSRYKPLKITHTCM